MQHLCAQAGGSQKNGYVGLVFCWCSLLFLGTNKVGDTSWIFSHPFFGGRTVCRGALVLQEVELSFLGN